MPGGSGDSDRRTARRAGMIQRFLTSAMAAFLAACSPAPSASPPPASSVTPSAAATAEPTATGPADTAIPTSTPYVPPPTTFPADLKYAGSLAVLPATPAPGFEADIECSRSIGKTDPVAIVTLEGRPEQAVLRDYADVSDPRTVCTFGDIRVVQLIDARHIVIADRESPDLFAVVDLPDVQYRWFKLPTSKGSWGTDLITVGPALDRVIWKAVHVKNTDTDVVYMSTEARTVELATLPDSNSGRCGSPTDSSWGAYTTSGSHLYVLNQPILPNHSLLVIKGRETLLSVIPPHVEWADGNAPVMAVWSPVSPTLYWSQGGDVFRWTPDGGRQKFIAGVSWSGATISADGRYLAYSVPRADGKEVVYLVDLTGDDVPHRIGDGARGEPRFLNATQLWWRVQSTGRGCTGPLPGPAVYNVANGSEDGSIIDQIQGTWPATSAKQWS